MLMNPPSPHYYPPPSFNNYQLKVAPVASNPFPVYPSSRITGKQIPDIPFHP